MHLSFGWLTAFLAHRVQRLPGTPPASAGAQSAHTLTSFTAANHGVPYTAQPPIPSSQGTARFSVSNVRYGQDSLHRPLVDAQQADAEEEDMFGPQG